LNTEGVSTTAFYYLISINITPILEEQGSRIFENFDYLTAPSNSILTIPIDLNSYFLLFRIM